MTIRYFVRRVKEHRSVRIWRVSPAIPLEPGNLPPPKCPECHGPQFVHVDPEDGPELLCPACVCWVVAK